jgi:hypothetical protein
MIAINMVNVGVVVEGDGIKTSAHFKMSERNVIKVH